MSSLLTYYLQFSQSSLLPDVTGSGLPETMDFGPISGLELFLIKVLNFFLFFLGIITLLAVFYGGYVTLTAAGNEEQASKGKKILVEAIVGFLLVTISYAVVRTLLFSTTSLLPI